MKSGKKAFALKNKTWLKNKHWQRFRFFP